MKRNKQLGKLSKSDKICLQDTLKRSICPVTISIKINEWISNHFINNSMFYSKTDMLLPSQMSELRRAQHSILVKVEKLLHSMSTTEAKKQELKPIKSSWARQGCDLEKR